MTQICRRNCTADIAVMWYSSLPVGYRATRSWQFFIKLIKSLFAFFGIWLKTNIFTLWRKDNYQCFSTARILAYHYLCCLSSLQHFILAFFFMLRCVNHYVRVDFDRKWSGRLLFVISVPGSGKPYILDSSFCGLVFLIWPQGPDEPVCLLRRSLELREYVTMSHVKCWKMPEDKSIVLLKILLFTL